MIGRPAAVLWVCLVSDVLLAGRFGKGVLALFP